MKAELDEIKDGLQALDFLSLLKNYPTATRQLFVAVKCCLTADSLQDLFIVSSFSPEGSNVREVEEKTYIYFINFLQELEGTILIPILFLA